MNLLIGKWILDEREAVLPILKFGVWLEVEPRQLPEPVVVLVEDFAALPQVHAQLFVNLFIEVLQQLLTGLLDPLVNLLLQFLLKLIEVELNLILSTALLVNVRNSLLEIDAGADAAKH